MLGRASRSSALFRFPVASVCFQIASYAVHSIESVVHPPAKDGITFAFVVTALVVASPVAVAQDDPFGGGNPFGNAGLGGDLGFGEMPAADILGGDANEAAGATGATEGETPDGPLVQQLVERGRTR
jgi:hypothetical protein